MRSFLAVEVPQPEREKIRGIINDFKDLSLPIKWVEFENLHITVKFLGEIGDDQKDRISSAVAELCKLFPAFKACLNGLGCFPGLRNPRVLWTGLSQGEDKLRLLARDLENLLAKHGVRPDDKLFHPHLTFGRVKAFCKVDDILARDLTGEPFAVDKLTFFKSQLLPGGPRYEVLEKFSLG
jgi:2'-5' RNA ligase